VPAASFNEGFYKVRAHLRVRGSSPPSDLIETSPLCGAPHNAEIGAAWSKRSSEGRDYLSVKLDDPSFTVPIYANLVEDGETFNLIWSRSRKQNGE
jgi:Protein of unknown function (DUF736)